MKFILAVLGLVLLVPRRSGANFLRHVFEAEAGTSGGGGRVLQSCEQDCQYDMCTVEGDAECLREAEETADQKWMWCVGLDGKYGKFQDTVECGMVLKKPKYNCGKFAECVEEKHCSIYALGRSECDAFMAEEKAKWALDSCRAGQYKKIDAWNPACVLDDFPYEDGEKEINCSMFASCVDAHNCDEYKTAGCDDNESEIKAEWALNTCKTNPAKANQWKEFCPIENYSMDPVCDAFRGCMVKAMYNQNIEKKLDFKISTCVSQNRFESECSTKCKANCPCNDQKDMTECAELYDKCRAENDSKKCFKKAEKKSFKGCCCLEENCVDAAEGFEDCALLMDYSNRAGTGSSDDTPLPIDYCDPSPCQNRGMCINDQDKKTFVCKCDKGYTGERCELAINYCLAPSRCGSHGTCSNEPSNVAGFVCVCDRGYQGKLCEQEIDFCKSSPCGSHGTCYNKPSTSAGFTCVCDPGYQGKLCEQEIDFCKSIPCGSHGTCYNKPSTFAGFACVCDPGYEGEFCKRDINFCSTNLCGNHGTCINRSSGYICRCDPGYEGKLCKREMDYCSQDPCMNGTCRNDPPNETYKCRCDQYWRGTNCNIPVNRCASAPCQNSATCSNDPTVSKGYKCICPKGFAGEFCEFDFGGGIVEYRYACTLNAACRCYDGNCEHTRGTYESYEDVTRGECEKMCNENSNCNGIEYNPSEKKCEAHTDEMMDRKGNSDTMCCEKQEISINRVPDPPSSDEEDCIACTDEPTIWMSKNNKRCDNWTWGIPLRCNESPENSEYPYWRNNHFCELSCAKARGGLNYPGRPRCCQLD